MDLGALVRRLVAGPTGAGGAAPSGDSGGVPAATQPAPDVASGAFARPAWRDLPPLQRIVGAAPLVAPNAAFESRLATSRPAPIALAPLGHERGLEAPAGLVTGIAAPVQRTPSSPMPASVRMARAGRAADTVQRSAVGTAWPDASPSDAAPDVSGDAPAAAPSAAPDPVLPAPSPSPFTTAPSPGTGLVGFVGHAAVASAARGSSLPASAVATSVAAPGTPSAPLVSRSVATDGGPTVGAPLISAASSLAGAAGRSSIGDRPVRRVRLGAPLTPTVSRIAVPGVPATSVSGPGPMPAPGITSEIAMPPSAGMPASATGPAASTAGSEPGAQAAGSAGGPLPAQLQVVGLQRQGVSTPAMSPLVGGLRPLLATMSPAVTIARSAVPDAAADAPVPASSRSAALAALARVDPGSADWAPAAMAASVAGGMPGGPGFGFEPASPGGISPARLTWSNPMADLSTPSSGPGPLTSPGTPSSGFTSAPGSPTVSRSAARTGGLRVGPAVSAAVVRPAAGTVARSAAASASPGSASSSFSALSSTASASSSSTTSAPNVSRAVVIDEIDVTPEPSPSAAESGAGEAGAGGGASASEQGAAGAAGGSHGSGAPASGMSEAARDQETQVWADRLYDRIALRLRRDLLVERERAGALVDRGF